MKNTVKSFLFSILAALIFTIESNAQESVSLDLIISIDGQLPAGTITSFKILTQWSDGHREEIASAYYPGNLLISKNDYSKLNDKNLTGISFKFYRSVTCSGKTETRLYLINVSKAFIEHKYYIVSIINKNKLYEYDLFYPGGAVTRIIRNAKLCD